MNERDIPAFDQEGIERVLRSVNSNPNNLLSLDQRDMKIISSAILRYAEICGLVAPQSRLK
jgi:low affinity Fe/Cu permease